MSNRRLDRPAADTPALLRELLAAVRGVEARLARIEAAMINGSPSRSGMGRPRVDDADALSEIAELIAGGVDRATAIKRIAIELGGNVEAHQQRLRRKLS